MALLVSVPDVHVKRKPHPTLTRGMGPLHRPRFLTPLGDDEEREVVPND
jgi:hypothetical protein